MTAADSSPEASARAVVRSFGPGWSAITTDASGQMIVLLVALTSALIVQRTRVPILRGLESVRS